jgi:hypothetical protein
LTRFQQRTGELNDVAFRVLDTGNAPLRPFRVILCLNEDRHAALRQFHNCGVDVGHSETEVLEPPHGESNIVLPLVRDGSLDIILPERAKRLRGLYAVYPSKRFAPRKLTTFVQFLVDTFSERSDLAWSGVYDGFTTERL